MNALARARLPCKRFAQNIEEMSVLGIKDFEEMSIFRYNNFEEMSVLSIKDFEET